MNIYEQITSNKRKTIVLIIGFVGFITLIGFLLGYIYGGTEFAVFVMLFASFFSFFFAIGSYYFSDKAVLSISGARKVNKEEAPQIYGILENLCIGAGIKKVPDLYIINDSAPNAFATGRDVEHSVIAVTTGLLDKLDKRELEGVLAHELSHIRNYDIRLMTIIVILAGIVTLIANMIFYGGFGGKDRKSGGTILIVVGVFLIILSPIVAEIIKLAVSRNREFLADASGAMLTRDPAGLASALQKISSDPEPLEVANEATAHMYISNPLKKGVNSDFLANLFNTHPSVEERIKRLHQM